MLGVILLVGGLVRFWYLGSRGLFLSDEGFLHLEAGTVHALLFGARPDGLPLGMQFMTPVRSGRLAHDLLLAFLEHIHPGADAGPLLSAIAGTLVIALTWHVADRLWGRREAVLGALLVALSPFAVAYSRAGLSDMLGTMWSLVALAAFLACAPVRGGRPSGRWTVVGAAAVAGFAGAGAVLTSDRYAHVLLLLPVAVLLMRAPARLILPTAGVGAALPLLAGEWLERRWTATWGPGVFPGGALVSQLAGFYGRHGAEGFAWRGAHAFFSYLAADEGPVSAVAAVVAIGWLAADRQRDRREWAVHLWWLAPLLLWSAYWTKCHRFFCHAIPFLALLKARWICHGMARLSRRGWVPAAAGLVLAASSLPALQEELVMRAPYAQALTIAGARLPLHLSTNIWVGAALGGFGRCQPVPSSRRELDGLQRAGYAGLMTDLQMWFGGLSDADRRLDLVARVTRGRKPLVSIPYDRRGLRFFAYNQAQRFETLPQAIPALAGAGILPAVRVYALPAE